MAVNICVEDQKKNLNKSQCVSLPKLFKRGIWTPDNFELEVADQASGAALRTAFQNLILNPYASRGYLLPDFSNLENNSEDAVYVDGPLGRRPVRDGQYRFKPMISHNLCTHRALFTHRAKNRGRFFPFDVDNQLFGTQGSAVGKLRGFKIALFWTEKLKFSNGTDETESPIIIDLADNKEIDKYGFLLDGTSLLDLEPLTDVSITLTEGDAFAAAEFNVDVKQTCDGTPLSGLLTADFLVYQADGITPQALTSATEDANNPGRYNLNGAVDFVDGVIKLRAPSLLTVKAYELLEPLEFEI